ncbi:MAG: hypothetical protein ACE5O2_10965 [Armatimonadota bacterium]
MTRTLEQCVAAREKLERLIDGICGSCEKSCCHQGTMMGSHDLRRLRKGLLASPDFARRFFHSLHRRLDEVEEDIEQLLELCDVIDATGQVCTTEAPLLLKEWRDYVAELRAIREPDMPALRNLLLFSAKRARALRAVRAIPGAIDVLHVMGPRPSLRFQRRRLPADRCLFHYEGCFAERYKPAKCANFFCTLEPGLIGEVFNAMGFDEFVRANVLATPMPDFVRLIELEARLGEEYLESKVVLGEPAIVAHIVEALHASGVACDVHNYPGALMLSKHELIGISPRQAGTIGILTCDAVSGAALYEIGMAADVLWREQPGRVWYIVARTLVSSSQLAHPLWQDRAICQPIGALEMYLVTGDQS